MNRLECCVCGRAIRQDDNDVFVVLDHGLRHKKCGPGTKQWAKKFGENEITKMLKPKSKPAATKDHLAGRVKYMRYMDQFQKMEWSITFEGRTVTSNDPT